MNPHSTDPVIDEIRETRHEISKRFNHDPARLVAHYMQLQQRHGDRLIVGGEPAEEPERPRA